MNCHEEVRVQLRQSPVKPCYLETPSTPGFWQKCYGTELTMAIYMSYHHLSLATSREQNKLGFPRINYYAASWKISYFRFVLGNKCMIGRTILCMSGISGIIEYGEITPVCKFHIIICVMLNMFNFLMSTGHNFNLFSLLTRTDTRLIWNHCSWVTRAIYEIEIYTIYQDVFMARACRI